LKSSNFKEIHKRLKLSLQPHYQLSHIHDHNKEYKDEGKDTTAIYAGWTKDIQDRGECVYIQGSSRKEPGGSKNIKKSFTFYLVVKSVAPSTTSSAGGSASLGLGG